MKFALKAALVAAVVLSGASAWCDDLDESIFNHLSPQTFEPSLIDENTVIRVIKSSGTHMLVGGREIRRAYAQAAAEGMKFKIEDFTVTRQAQAGNVVSVLVQAKVTQMFHEERHVERSILHEEWQRRPFGWVLLSGVAEELPVDDAK
jgi:hypothetical protein